MTILLSNQALLTANFSLASSNRPMAVTMGITNSSSADALTLATAYSSALNASSTYPFHSTHMADVLTFDNITCFLNRGGILTTAEFPVNVTGVGSWQPPPAQICLNVQKVTGFSGRKFRGRFFGPSGLLDGEDCLPDGQITPSVVTALQTRFTAMRTYMVGAGLNPIIIHGDGSAGTPVSSFLVKPSLATLRHRKPRS